MSWKIAAVKIWSVYFKQSRTTVVKNIRNISESYLGLCRTCENSKRYSIFLKPVKTPSEMEMVDTFQSWC